MTEAIKSLRQAVKQLENASKRYSQAIKDGGDPNDVSLYTSINGEAWQNYLKAGGSRTMINPQLPRHLDFNGKRQLS